MAALDTLGTAAQAGPAGHTAHLAHHFETADQQLESGKLGMWIFLGTEILLFGGLFCAYAVYRANHPEVFEYAHRFLDKRLGALNTAILICSSFTVAWAVRSAQRGRRRATIAFLAVTIACAFAFLGVKGIEYHQKWREGLLWGAHYRPRGEAAVKRAAPALPTTLPKPPGVNADVESLIPPAAVGPPGLAKPGQQPLREIAEKSAPENVQTFFAVYFLMTGLHGLHVIAGIIVLTIMMIRAARGEFSEAYFTPMDLAGLYWHLVDIIWIYLFPLLYLIH